MNERNFTPEEYLKKNLETARDKDNTAEAKLDIPLCSGCENVDFVDKGEQHFDDGKIDLSLSYTEMDSDAKRTFVEEIKNTYRHPSDQLEVKKYEDFFAQKVVATINYCISRKDDASSLIDFQTIIPGGLICFFAPDNPLDSKERGCWITGHVAFTSVDPLKLGGLLSILHEAGHSIQGHEAVLFDEYESNDQDLETAQKILENERDAWAFALKKIKPFISSDQKQSILNFIHGHDLTTYSNALREILKQRLEGDFDSIFGED